MSEDDHQKGIVEYQRKHPEPFVCPKSQRGTFTQLRFCVSEQGSEQEHFKRHSSDHPDCRGRVIPFGLFDPGQGFSLAARWRNTKRDGGFCPVNHLIDDAPDENGQRYVGEDHTKEVSTADCSSSSRANIARDYTPPYPWIFQRQGRSDRSRQTVEKTPARPTAGLKWTTAIQK